ncbi:hypothetical protein GO986_19810 [Deinococcus sp. HMF7620]|uniref:Uncharacterized protein n=1 Tax=Deinococcus arboris TaxID=2682977 RepID=A0A7C9I5H9_9DEIO|nr:hypothetical protein [Deinococcus arboris]MVN88991.1 hypothetical protein [Deinococcus arboris]
MSDPTLTAIPVLRRALWTGLLLVVVPFFAHLTFGHETRFEATGREPTLDGWKVDALALILVPLGLITAYRARQRYLDVAGTLQRDEAVLWWLVVIVGVCKLLTAVTIHR